MQDPLYREIILEHWQNPRNYGIIINPDFDSVVYNPTCGDKIKIMGKIKNKKLIKISFVLEGCAISKASASLFTEKVKNMTVRDILKINKDEVLKELTIDISPTRYNCALLGYNALIKSISDKK
jgi:nitrogen fixation protein NifU and related proteins